MRRGYAAVGLFSPKTPANVGSVLRAMGNFSADLLVLAGKRYPVQHCPTDTQKAWRHMPVQRTDGDLLDLCPVGAVPVAIEIVEGARPLTTYTHPERAYYVFGPEDGSLPPRITERCADVLYVPTTHCMNLGVSVAVVLYDRMVKA